MKLKIQSIFRKLRHHQLFLLLALLFVSVNAAKAEQLYFSYNDPVADQTGSVDVTAMNFLFDTDTGNYTVILLASPGAPFLGQFRVNVNLYNPDALPAYSLFQDNFNEFDLSTATYRIKLTGTNPSLQYWARRHRVATSNQAGVGVPVGVGTFRSSLSTYPITFLTNEDTIAYGTSGLTAITSYSVQIKLELQRAIIQENVYLGILTQAQASELRVKLSAAINSLNLGMTSAACSQLQAFLHTVKSYVQQGVVNTGQGNLMMIPVSQIRAEIGCS